MKIIISAIAAVAKNRAIGKNGKLIWHIPEDLTHFMRTTKNHVVIMGSTTFVAELKSKPLKDRTNIILTRQADLKAPGCIVCHSIDEAIEKGIQLEKNGEIFIIGGGNVYAQALNQAERLYLTLVDAEFPDADTFFPEYSHDFNQVISRRESGDDNYRYSFLVLERS